MRVLRVGEEDFICLTDMAAGRGDDVRAADVIKNWLRARYTLEFLGTWEQLHNPAFKVVEFDHFKGSQGLVSPWRKVSELHLRRGCALPSAMPLGFTRAVACLRSAVVLLQEAGGFRRQQHAIAADGHGLSECRTRNLGIAA